MLAAGVTMLGVGGPDVERITYRGWPGSVRLSNRSVEMVIVPAIGRIMRFAPTGGPNPLWENPALTGKLAAPDRTEWTNFGGDKLWPAPQARWGWPPDAHLDGSAWRLRIRSDRSVVMDSPVSPTLRLRFRRTIAMHATAPEATIRNELINDGDKPVEWSVWEIAQVDDPEWVGMPRDATSGFPEGHRVFPGSPLPPGALEVTTKHVEARRNATQAYKIGGDPDDTRLSCRKDGWTFTISGARRGAGPYPDEGCSVEVYSNPDPLPYMEMEILGPIVRIEPGRHASLVTRWRLSRGR